MKCEMSMVLPSCSQMASSSAGDGASEKPAAVQVDSKAEVKPSAETKETQKLGDKYKTALWRAHFNRVDEKRKEAVIADFNLTVEELMKRPCPPLEFSTCYESKDYPIVQEYAESQGFVVGVSNCTACVSSYDFCNHPAILTFSVKF